MNTPRSLLRNPLLWVSTLYLAEGIPYNVINNTTSTMFKSMGMGDGKITVSLGYVMLMWSLKPIWAAFLDMYRTKKFFVLTTELLLALVFTCVAMCLSLPGFFLITIALLWVAAFASATQDICADGIYLTALDKTAQAKLAGVQGMFWNLGKVLATGGLVSGMSLLAASQNWTQQRMWMGVWIAAAAVMLLLALFHFVRLPTGSVEQRPTTAKQVWGDFLGSAATFFHKRAFWGMIAFVFLYRLGEGLLQTEGKLFLQSSIDSGGLGLNAAQVSNIDAVWGTIASIAGGIIGGLYMGKIGLSRALPVLGLCLNIPHITFVILSHYGAAGHGLDYSVIVSLVSIEKFGYGFGFIGNMVYMMQQLAPGRSTMTHYAFATALMNLVLVPTNMVSGPLAEILGYSTYFIIVMFASVPSVIAAFKAPFPHRTESSLQDESGRSLLDDPARLQPAERIVQQIAGRASMFAMLDVLTILIVDAYILGTLHGAAEGAGRTQFVFLLGSLALKLFFSWQSFRLADEAFNAAAAAGEKNYVGNARGAKVATLICTVVSIAIMAFGARMAF